MARNENNQQLEKYVSFKTLCDTLELGERTLRRHIAAQRFPRPDLRIGNRYRWRRSTIEAFLTESAKKIAG